MSALRIAGVLIGLAPIVVGCSPQKQPPAPTVELGLCYAAVACTGDFLVNSVPITKDACTAAGGKSWKGTQSGCKNL